MEGRQVKTAYPTVQGNTWGWEVDDCFSCSKKFKTSDPPLPHLPGTECTYLAVLPVCGFSCLPDAERKGRPPLSCRGQNTGLGFCREEGTRGTEWAGKGKRVGGRKDCGKVRAVTPSKIQTERQSGKSKGLNYDHRQNFLFPNACEEEGFISHEFGRNDSRKQKVIWYRWIRTCSIALSPKTFVFKGNTLGPEY